jgi:hypothetical protein
MKKLIPLIVLCQLLAISVFGTHLRGGEITSKKLQGFTYEITVTVFTNTINSNVLFGGEDDWLDFGDGTRLLVPETANIPRPDLGEGVATASFKILHTYPGFGSYLISYQEPNRNALVINMLNSVNTRFYIETYFTLDPTISSEGSPVFPLAPIFRGIIGQPFTASFVGLDPEDRSTLFYKVVTPKQDRNKNVEGYVLPENFKINPYNGVIEWDTKFKGGYQQGEYSFAVQITKTDSEGRIISHVLRDFQIILSEDLTTTSIDDDADLDDNNRVYIPIGNEKVIKVFAKATNVNEISMEVFSTGSDLDPDSYEFEISDSTNGSSIIKIGYLILRNTGAYTSDNPYNIVVRSKFKNSPYFADIGYLFYTKDVSLSFPVILSVGEEKIKTNAYPNPVRDFLNLNFPPGDIKGVVVENETGESFPATLNVQGQLDMRQLIPGLYFIRLYRSDSAVNTIKIIKQ